MAAATINGTALAAAREHLLSGMPLTRMEALVLFGLSNLPELVYELRQQQFKIESRRVSYATAMVRINQNALLKPPPNLPIRDIMFTEYWISR
jgi:hypothetical protein